MENGLTLRPTKNFVVEGVWREAWLSEEEEHALQEEVRRKNRDVLVQSMEDFELLRMPADSQIKAQFVMALFEARRVTAFGAREEALRNKVRELRNGFNSSGNGAGGEEI